MYVSVCVYTPAARVLKDMRVCGRGLPPVGGSFIDFSRTLAHTHSFADVLGSCYFCSFGAVSMLIAVVVVPAPATLPCNIHSTHINALGLAKLAPHKTVFQKQIVTLSNPPLLRL